MRVRITTVVTVLFLHRNSSHLCAESHDSSRTDLSATNLDDRVDIAINPVNHSHYLVDDVQSRVRLVH